MTLSEILKSANAYLDLEYTLPTGDELTTRVSFANQALNDGFSAYRFDELSETFYPSTSTLSSYSLPSNFREMEIKPAVELNGGITYYPQIKKKDINKYDSTDNYCYVEGTPEDYSVVFKNLTANATVSIPFQRYPSGMATLTDVCELPDAEYVKMKLISYVLQSRSDERFPSVDAKAEILLSNMIGRSMQQPSGGIPQIPRIQTYQIGR